MQNIPNFHGTLCAVLIAFIYQLYGTVNMLDEIPPFWRTSFAPCQVFCAECKARSYALCKDKEALLYVKVHRSGAQLRFQIRQQRGASVQRNNNGLLLHCRSGVTSSCAKLRRHKVLLFL